MLPDDELTQAAVMYFMANVLSFMVCLCGLILQNILILNVGAGLCVLQTLLVTVYAMTREV